MIRLNYKGMFGGIILKRILPFVLLICVAMTLFGCQQNTNIISKIQPEQTSEVGVKMGMKTEKNPYSITKAENIKTDESAIIKVGISEGNETIIFDDVHSIEIFNTVLINVIKEKDLVDVADPEFRMDVYTKDSLQSFYLWIGNKGETSALMRSDDTRTIYTIPKDLTEQLIKLIEG